MDDVKVISNRSFGIFFFVVIPIGLLIKIFKKDLLNLKYNDDASYWIKKMS